MSEPKPLRNEEAGYVEFANEDVPYFVREIDGSVAILFDAKIRNVIGYRVYDRAPSPSPTPGVVEALQQAAQIAGDACWSRPMPKNWDRDKEEYSDWCAAQSKFVRGKIHALASLSPQGQSPAKGEREWGQP